ncbi:MAG TPA: tyrosine-type recombinase/integrase [Acetobacteraceae bacterium]
MRAKLTDTLLLSLAKPGAWREVSDTHTPGLLAKISKSGTVILTVRARTRDGKRTSVKLGRWPTVGLAAARKTARTRLGEIAHGGDPVAAQHAARAERTARQALPTVALALERWRAARTAPGAKPRPWSPRYTAEVERLCVKFIEPTLGRRLLADATRADWTGMIAAERSRRPATATWLYQLASAFLAHAEAHGWIASHPLPRRGLAVIAPKASPRGRALADTELVRVWHAADALPAKPHVFTHLLITTGCRVSEAAGIAAGEIDFATGRWTIPAERAKNRTAITLPLPEGLANELRALLPVNPAPGYRLLGSIAGSGLSGVSSIKRRLDAASGVTGWVMHDLRRTARTGMTRLGIIAEHAEAALNHVSGRSQLNRTYNVHDYAPEVLAALGAWQTHVLALVGPDIAGTEPLSAAIVPPRAAAQ